MDKIREVLRDFHDLFGHHPRRRRVICTVIPFDDVDSCTTSGVDNDGNEVIHNKIPVPIKQVKKPPPPKLPPFPKREDLSQDELHSKYQIYVKTHNLFARERLKFLKMFTQGTFKHKELSTQLDSCMTQCNEICRQALDLYGASSINARKCFHAREVFQRNSEILLNSYSRIKTYGELACELEGCL